MVLSKLTGQICSVIREAMEALEAAKTQEWSRSCVGEPRLLMVGNYVFRSVNAIVNFGE
jgi:hypothetical protein